MKKHSFRAWILLFCLCDFFIGCSDDNPLNDTGSQEQVGPAEHAWLLVGDWTFVQSFNSQSPHQAKNISLKADGSGSADGGTLKWHTKENEVIITFADGSKLNTIYHIHGALLSLNQYAEYVMDIPIVGTWYASEPGNKFMGNHLIYWIKQNGEAFTCSFGTDGLNKYDNLKWNRTQKGIQLQQQNKVEDMAFKVDAGKLSIEGKGDYVNIPPYKGLWEAIASSKGNISSQDISYSTVEIRDAFEKLYFICKYKSRSMDGKYYPSTYQAIVKPAFSYQQQLFILYPVDGSGDAMSIHFRFYYAKETQKVYLDLSTENNFTNYVRYEYLKQ